MKKDYQGMSVTGLCTLSLKNLGVAILLANKLTKHYGYYWTTLYLNKCWHVTDIFAKVSTND